MFMSKNLLSLVFVSAILISCTGGEYTVTEGSTQTEQIVSPTKILETPLVRETPSTAGITLVPTIEQTATLTETPENLVDFPLPLAEGPINQKCWNVFDSKPVDLIIQDSIILNCNGDTCNVSFQGSEYQIQPIELPTQERLTVDEFIEKNSNVLPLNDFYDQGGLLSHRLQPAPDQSQVVYLNNRREYVLWDIPLQEQLWVGATGLQLYTGIDGFKWSSSGEEVAISLGGFNQDTAAELVLINNQGMEKRLTYFSEAYPPGYEVLPGNFSWAPDGEKIAIWASIFRETPAEWHLYLLDVHSGETTDSCISSGIGGPAQFPYTVWSPDSQQLITESFFKNGETGRSNYHVIIDLPSETACLFPEDFILLDWISD